MNDLTFVVVLRGTAVGGLLWCGKRISSVQVKSSTKLEEKKEELIWVHIGDKAELRREIDGYLRASNLPSNRRVQVLLASLNLDKLEPSLPYNANATLNRDNLTAKEQSLATRIANAVGLTFKKKRPNPYNEASRQM